MYMEMEAERAYVRASGPLKRRIHGGGKMCITIAAFLGQPASPQDPLTRYQLESVLLFLILPIVALVVRGLHLATCVPR